MLRTRVYGNDFVVDLLDMGTEWKSVMGTGEQFEGRDRKNGELM